MRYLTGLGSPCAWRLFAGAAILDLLQPWRADARHPHRTDLESRASAPRVRDHRPLHEREPRGGVFRKAFRLEGPASRQKRPPAPAGGRAGKGSGRASGQVTRFFGEEFGGPLVEYTAARLGELEREGCPCNFIELYVFRTLPGTPPNFEGGHSHFLRPYVALFKMETGPSTRVRADGMPYGAPPATLVGVDTDCALRFTHSWHAGPHVEADGEPRFGIVLNARVYGPQQLAEAVVTS